MPTLIEALQSLRAILARGPQRKIVPYTDPEIKAAIHAVMRAANETDEMTGQEIGGFLASKVNLRLMPLPAPPMILRQLDTMIGDMGGRNQKAPTPMDLLSPMVSAMPGKSTRHWPAARSVLLPLRGNRKAVALIPGT